jgi:hypothetical protein
MRVVGNQLVKPRDGNTEKSGVASLIEYDTDILVFYCLFPLSGVYYSTFGHCASSMSHRCIIAIFFHVN